ncbi:MAG: DUF4145 domain-containing protein [Deltaproteobacteria bacterium]|nr:DUF4145 domain-containing protein [Deltaproteobacteria bacterium]
MLKLESQLLLDRCPYCSIKRPNLKVNHELITVDHRAANKRRWKIYKCESCGGVILANTNEGTGNNEVSEIYPKREHLDEAIPEKPRTFLQEAIDSIHAPSASIMVCASSIDAMLKELGYKEGTLYSRIAEAKNDCILTPGMEAWANEIRLDANEQRHADEVKGLPSPAEALQSVEFAKALAEFLFVLPSRVKRGIEESKQTHIDND